MAILSVILLILFLLVLVFYEIFLKKRKVRRARGKKIGVRVDWKNLIMQELKRKSYITPDEASAAGGVSQKKAERYLDRRERDGVVRQAGDAERGIFYKLDE